MASTQMDIKPVLRKLKAITQYTQHDVKRIMGTEAIKHFQKNFDNEAWEGVKWQESKRRIKSSAWYGFEAGARVKPPDNHPRRKGAKAKYKARKPNPITNYSPAARKRKTLSGLTGDLRDSIDYKITPTGVVVFSDLPYARIHNEGGYARRFGKKPFRMPKRQFMGDSPKLRQKIKRELTRGLNRALK